MDIFASGTESQRDSLVPSLSSQCSRHQKPWCQRLRQGPAPRLHLRVIGGLTQPFHAMEAPGGVAWDLETGAKPSWARPKPEVRPPKWVGGGKYGRGRVKEVKPLTAKRLESFKGKQLETLKTFRKYRESQTWEKLHRHHFDWWMFPIDDGSKAEFNLSSEEDVAALQRDVEWMEGYHEGLDLACKAWGWDLWKACRIEPMEEGMGWTNWDVRLAKMCRSLYLMQEEELLNSLQKFARELQANEKQGKGFFYCTICLDELLYFQLPRS